MDLDYGPRKLGVLAICLEQEETIFFDYFTNEKVKVERIGGPDGRQIDLPHRLMNIRNIQRLAESHVPSGADYFLPIFSQEEHGKNYIIPEYYRRVD